MSTNYIFVFFILFIQSLVQAKDNISIENLTPHQLHVAAYSRTSGKRTNAGVRVVPPSGTTEIPQASSSFFPTTNKFVVVGAYKSDELPEQAELIRYSYSIIDSGVVGQQTKKIFLQEVGDRIGATAQERTDAITIVNDTKHTVYVVLCYDDGATAYCWGKPQAVEPYERVQLQRPERKCLQERLGVCTKYYDRNIYFTSVASELAPVMQHKQTSYINVGSLEGASFVIYEQNNKLKAASELKRKVENTRKAVATIIEPDLKKVKEKFDALDYPGKNKVATVRENIGLSNPETAFRLKRTEKYNRPACKALYKKLYNKELPDSVPVPTIALCVSGGGCRAMFTLAGLLAAAEQVEFLPLLTYIATLSGSTWALASWLYYNKSAREHLEFLCKQFTSGIWSNFDVLQVQEAVLRKKAYGQPQSIIDIYGALLGDKLFKSYAPHRNPNELFWGGPIKSVENAEVPYPLYTAVTPRNFSDLELSANPFEYYHWLTFDPYEVSVVNQSIPSWGFGRFISKSVSVESIPPCSVGYMLGIFGAAMSINTQDVGNIFFKSIQPAYADELINITSKSKPLSLLMQQRASPAKIPNFVADGLMTIVDAGVDLIFPFPPLMKRERTVDIIISVDGSAGIKLAPGLRGFSDYLKKQKIDFPTIDLKTIGKKPYTVVWDKKLVDAPMLIHLPLINRASYEDNWDPETSLWANTFNFVYSEQQAKKLSGLSGHMFKEAHEAIERAIGEWLEERVAYSTRVPPEAVS